MLPVDIKLRAAGKRGCAYKLGALHGGGGAVSGRHAPQQQHAGRAPAANQRRQVWAKTIANEI